MNFHETRYGARFFDGQLPKLISALEGIATALKAPAPVYQLKAEIPEHFLSDLYHGNYKPSHAPDWGTKKELLQEIVNCDKDLRGNLTPEQWLAVEKYISLLNSRNAFKREQAFAEGFQAAMTMLAAGLGYQTNNEMKE